MDLLQSSDSAVVSSSRVRELLASGQMDQAADLLDRRFRLYFHRGALELAGAEAGAGPLSIPLAAAINQEPGPGRYPVKVLWGERVLAEGVEAELTASHLVLPAESRASLLAAAKGLDHQHPDMLSMLF